MLFFFSHVFGLLLTAEARSTTVAGGSLEQWKIQYKWEADEGKVGQSGSIKGGEGEGGGGGGTKHQKNDNVGRLKPVHEEK